jgi:hypothetical protein
MEKIFAYGEAEAIYDHQNNQQRQAKIEILTQSAARRDSHGSRAGLTYVRLLCSRDHNLHAMLPQETVELIFSPQSRAVTANFWPVILVPRI